MKILTFNGERSWCERKDLKIVVGPLLRKKISEVKGDRWRCDISTNCGGVIVGEGEDNEEVYYITPSYLSSLPHGSPIVAEVADQFPEDPVLELP